MVVESSPNAYFAQRFVDKFVALPNQKSKLDFVLDKINNINKAQQIYPKSVLGK